MNRASNTGELMAMDAFDMKVFEVASRVVAQYGIEYDAEEPICSADMAESIFLAGLQAYEELGTYCIDTGRVIRFNAEEIASALEDLTYFAEDVAIGNGKDRAVLRHRRPFDAIKPTAIGGVVESNPNEGSDFVQLYKSLFQEAITWGAYYGPAPHTCESRPWQLGSAWEVHAARNAVTWAREALRSVGRPGLHLIDASPTAIGVASVMMAGEDHQGLRTTDAVAIATISELKVNYEMLSKVALTQQFGCLRNPYWTSMIGGFAGGPEGAAVLCVAHALNAVLAYRVGGAGYCVVSAILQNPPVATARKPLWARNAAFQAISGNMNIICGGGGLTDAGPGTEQQLWEIAAMAMTISSGGAHVIQGIRKAVLKKPVQGSGLEPRWEAEVARATAGLPRDEVNRLMNYVLSKYESNIADRSSPDGYSFSDLYDVNTIVPTSDYLALYERVKTDLQEHGLRF
jgi:methylamine--corrinoid protein Co-methyltransferase